ncbi:MAG: hypothetical protein R2932_50760 [Caldilineaceae bacterium]
MFTGDSGTVAYTVAVEKTVADSDFAVSGAISIYNTDPNNIATIQSVVDDAGGVAGTVSCPATTVPAMTTLVCSYTAGPLATNTFGDFNTATVTTSGLVGGGTGTAPIVFGDPTTVNGYPSIIVNDSNGSTWSFDDSGSVSYERTFTCDTDEGTHDNTVTIKQTGQEDEAAVTVNCYTLTVTKDANTAFTRTYDWTINKSGDQSDLVLAQGQSFTVNYNVVVNTTPTDSNWAVNGSIAVTTLPRLTLHSLALLTLSRRSLRQR